MLGLVLIVLLFIVGDLVAKRYFSYLSLIQRLATAFLIGSMLSAVAIYLLALVFSSMASPLLWANLFYFALCGVLIYFSYFRKQDSSKRDRYLARPPGRNIWDVVFLGGFLIFATWLVYATLDYTEGSYAFAIKAWSDFGANLSLSQSFALGSNFPTEHPFLSGEPIRYHHLFWFLAGNVSFLGLNVVTSINILSILSFMAVAGLVMTLGETLFNSRIVGRISLLFISLSSTTLSYFTFLYSHQSISDALKAVWEQRVFVKGFPYRGDDWGALTISVLAYQRHLISAIGILLIVVIFLVGVYKRALQKRAEERMLATPPTISDPIENDIIAGETAERAATTDEAVEESIDLDLDETPDAEPLELPAVEPEPSSADLLELPETPTPDEPVESDVNEPSAAVLELPERDDLEAPQPIDEELDGPETAPKIDPVIRAKRRYFDKLDRVDLGGLILCGILIGLLPYWNSAVFVSAAIVIAALIVLLPARLSTITVFVVSLIVAVPQILYLQSGDKIEPGPALVYYGYIIPNATFTTVFEFIGWTFGLKLILLLAALILATGLHRRLLIAFTGLVLAVFIFQFSIDVFNNHKLLNVWNVLTSVFAAFAVWSIGNGLLWRKVLAGILAFIVLGGAIIDLFPIRNDAFVKIKGEDDRLTTWLLTDTQPRDIFLSDRLLSHPILFTGRKLFMGNPLFPWAAGYNTPVREALYRRMYNERDPAVLKDLLRQHNISFVAFDQGVRTNGFVTNLNEEVYKQHFELVYDDVESHYGRIAIYRVPD